MPRTSPGWCSSHLLGARVSQGGSAPPPASSVCFEPGGHLLLFKEHCVQMAELPSVPPSTAPYPFPPSLSSTSHCYSLSWDQKSHHTFRVQNQKATNYVSNFSCSPTPPPCPRTPFYIVAKITNAFSMGSLGSYFIFPSSLPLPLPAPCHPPISTQPGSEAPCSLSPAELPH